MTQQKIAATTNDAIQTAIHEPDNQRLIAKQLCAAFYKDDDGNAFQMTDGQADIWNTIMLKQHQRVQIETPTQYGKSEVLGMVTPLRAITFREGWTVLSGDSNKTDIIMGKAIKHIFDNEDLQKQIDPMSVPHIERLKHEKSKQRITFIKGGELRTLSADARNTKRTKEVLTGQGARNIVEDEAALIPNILQTMVLRMLGGFKDSVLIKIGNPFFRNHFYRTSQDPNYKKIHIDYKQALAEERFSLAFIEEMRKEPFFDVLYEVRFPSSDEVMLDGFRRLLTDELLEAAAITLNDFYSPEYFTEEIRNEQGETIALKPAGAPKLGSDFAGGGADKSVYSLRFDKVGLKLSTNRSANTMLQVEQILKYREAFKAIGLHDKNIATDKGGLGQGIGDRLAELGIQTNNVLFGQGAPDEVKQDYRNARAWMYYQLRQWLINGGKIVEDDELYELLSINYKVDPEKKFIIQPKEDLKKLLKELNEDANSPDFADSFVLTFANNQHLVTEDDYAFV